MTEWKKKVGAAVLAGALLSPTGSGVIRNSGASQMQSDISVLDGIGWPATQKAMLQLHEYLTSEEASKNLDAVTLANLTQDCMQAATDMSRGNRLDARNGLSSILASTDPKDYPNRPESFRVTLLGAHGLAAQAITAYDSDNQAAGFTKFDNGSESVQR